MPENNYALEWFNFGRERCSDPVSRFMMYWVAFNWLYNECTQEDEGARIKEYCKRHYGRLSLYDPFVTGAFFVFEDGPVRSLSHGKIEENVGLYKRLLRESGEYRVESLLITIYHVRCNLFHGSKSLLIQRDVELVRSSATIMEGYLKALLLDDYA